MKWKSTSSLFTSMGNDLLISHRLALRDLLVINNDQIFKQLFFSLRTDFSLIILFKKKLFLKNINILVF